MGAFFDRSPFTAQSWSIAFLCPPAHASTAPLGRNCRNHHATPNSSPKPTRASFLSPPSPTASCLLIIASPRQSRPIPTHLILTSFANLHSAPHRPSRACAPSPGNVYSRQALIAQRTSFPPRDRDLFRHTLPWTTSYWSADDFQPLRHIGTTQPRSSSLCRVPSRVDSWQGQHFRFLSGVEADGLAWRLERDSRCRG